MRNVIPLIVMVLLQVVTEAAPPSMSSSKCLMDLQGVYKREQAFIDKVFSDNKGWHINYTMASLVYDAGLKKYKTINTSGELIASMQIRYSKTGQVEMFMDNSDLFTVNHKNRTVIRTQSDRDVLSQKNYAYLDMLSDSVLKKYTVAACTSVNENGEDLIRYDIMPKDKTKAGFTKYSLYVDVVSQSFRKIHVQVNPMLGTGVKEYTMSIIKRDEIEIDNSWFPVKQKIFRDKEVLNKTFNNYRYTYLRNNHK